MYRVDERSGSMHGKKFLVREVYFGSDGRTCFVRLDFHPGIEPELTGMQARVVVQSLENSPPLHATVKLASGAASTESEGVECAFLRILELRFPLAAVHVDGGGGVRFQLSLWQGGLPIDAVPQQGWLEMSTTSPDEMAA